MKPWKLGRTTQCETCPWRVGANPHDIPNGYSEDLHCALEKTIAEPGSLHMPEELRVMACHYSKEGQEMHCIGWVYNQMGPGNNIPLRIKLMSCENISKLKILGAQHDDFKDTLPSKQNS